MVMNGEYTKEMYITIQSATDYEGQKKSFHKLI